MGRGGTGVGGFFIIIQYKYLVSWIRKNKLITLFNVLHITGYRLKICSFGTAIIVYKIKIYIPLFVSKVR